MAPAGDLWTILAAAGALVWLGILLAPWQPWRIRERFAAGDAAPDHTNLSHVTVLIPARDEARYIGATLTALGEQGSGLHVILVDDRSEDGTADLW
ncbi:MAG: glycosyltransferase, partial [Rhodospirillaceae bacterium]|nr:glycosyltransferase [Rhodospirillaceae bacterium]